MSINDRDPTLVGSLGVEHAGVANPTKSSSSSNPIETNFVSSSRDILMHHVRLILAYLG